VDNKGLLPGLQVYVKNPPPLTVVRIVCLGWVFRPGSIYVKWKCIQQRWSVHIYTNYYTLFHSYFSFHRP